MVTRALYLRFFCQNPYKRFIFAVFIAKNYSKSVTFRSDQPISSRPPSFLGYNRTPSCLRLGNSGHFQRFGLRSSIPVQGDLRSLWTSLEAIWGTFSPYPYQVSDYPYFWSEIEREHGLIQRYISCGTYISILDRPAPFLIVPGSNSIWYL